MPQRRPANHNPERVRWIAERYGLAWVPRDRGESKALPGEPGLTGTSRPFKGRVVITSAPQTESVAAIATCPEGKVVLGGGYNGGAPSFSGPGSSPRVPSTTQAWIVIGDVGSRAYAVCATVAS